ncbi:MAG: sulfatase-like hydrolase/transferase, partial [Erysipelothrix sp.]|nr:sulfatase-like hydrolase/transferase [Erysipelothrix sp.]
MQRYLKLLIKKVFLFIGVLVVSSTNWFITTFDELSLDEIIFHLKVPMTGSNSDFLLSYIKGPLLNSLLIFLLITSFYYIILRFLKYFEIKFTAKKLLTTIAITILLLYSFNYSYQALGFQDYIKNNLVTSTIYEEHYVKPSEDLITFPKNKRNLVYIFVESYESTFTSKDLGGALSFNTLDKIADLAKEYDHFSNTDKLGGAAAASGTSWTVAGMVAQTSGINLRLPINGNSYGQFEHFLPGAISIGDLLEKAGYNQTLFIGSDADFGGRKSFFTQHGNYTIKDYNYAIDQKLIPEDYLEWWGYEDEKLYEFAKDELLDLANLDQPFNFTMLTADTHHVDGYLTDGAKTPYEEQYKNVILNSSQQLYEFITWIQAQDFYENTTIVIAGDH